MIKIEQIFIKIMRSEGLLTEEEKDAMSDLLKVYKRLEHHKDTTVGLWATDKPDMVLDQNVFLFQIKY